MTSAAQQLGFWVNTAERGESFVYGRAGPTFYPSSEAMVAARKLADMGLVALVQRRESEDVIAYVAQRTFKRREAGGA